MKFGLVLGRLAVLKTALPKQLLIISYFWGQFFNVFMVILFWEHAWHVCHLRIPHVIHSKVHLMYRTHPFYHDQNRGGTTVYCRRNPILIFFLNLRLSLDTVCPKNLVGHKMHFMTKISCAQSVENIMRSCHTTYSWNIKWKKCAGMGLNGFIFKKNKWKLKY